MKLCKFYKVISCTSHSNLLPNYCVNHLNACNRTGLKIRISLQLYKSQRQTKTV